MSETSPTKTKVRRRQSKLKVAESPAEQEETPLERSSDTLTLRIKKRRLDDSQDAGPMIAEAAYYRAEKRGFAPGYEIEDWVAAENEVRLQLERV